MKRNIQEANRQLTKKQREVINKETDDLAKEVYGDSYGQEDKATAERYNLDGYKNDVDIKGGPFSVGNAKLSPDTLIINFTSAFGCPSASQCPITQAACYAVAGENRLKDTRSKNINQRERQSLLQKKDFLELFLVRKQEMLRILHLEYLMVSVVL